MYQVLVPQCTKLWSLNVPIVRLAILCMHKQASAQVGSNVPPPMFAWVRKRLRMLDAPLYAPACPKRPHRRNMTHSHTGGLPYTVPQHTHTHTHTHTYTHIHTHTHTHTHTYTHMYVCWQSYYNHAAVQPRTAPSLFNVKHTYLHTHIHTHTHTCTHTYTHMHTHTYTHTYTHTHTHMRARACTHIHITCIHALTQGQNALHSRP